MKPTTNKKQASEKSRGFPQNNVIHDWFKGPETKDVPLEVQKFFGYLEQPEPKAPISKAEAADRIEKQKRITQIVGAKWKYQDETLGQYKKRMYD